MECTLYQYWRSSASWRVRWALAVKGVRVQSVAVDLGRGDQFVDGHKARSPLGRVPVVVLDGRSLVESVAIFEYLEETIPEPALYPKDPWRRARVRQLVEVVNAAIQPLQNLAVLARVSAEPTAQRAWARHFNEEGLGALERMLESIAAEEPGATGFCVGGALTAADLFLVPQVAAARRFGVDPASYPRVLAAEAAALATEHAHGALPENQPDARHFKGTGG